MKYVQVADPNIISKLPEEIFNLLDTSRKSSILNVAKQQRFDLRSFVDQIFPVMIVFDFKDIESELKKYRDLETKLSDLGIKKETIERTLENYSETKLSDKEIATIIGTIKAVVTTLKSKYPSRSKYMVTQELNDAITTFEEGGSRTSNIPLSVTQVPFSEAVASGSVLKKLDLLYEKPTYIRDLGGPDRDVFIFRSYNALSREIDSIVSMGGIAENFSPKFPSIGQFLDYGHVAVGYRNPDGSIQAKINTPKVLSIIYDVLINTSANQRIPASEKAAAQFVEDSQQLEYFVEIDKDFAEGFLKMFVSIGGQPLRYENSPLNRLRGTALEGKKKVSQKRILNDLVTKIRYISQGTKYGTSVQDFAKKILTYAQSSPSLYEYILSALVAAVKGETITRFKKNSRKTKKEKVKLPNLQVTGIASKIAKIKKPSLPPPLRQRPLAGAESETSLNSLRTLLDGNLIETVKRNMGRGDRRDVLNLRSGRFAESVRVEKLTQGREGTVTAYYNYMRNPYATFSAGGRQEQPRSRDPKLLISRSIREVAIQAKITRLRAVLV